MSDRASQRLLRCGFLLLLLVAVLRTNYGMMDTDLPLGDETTYVARAFAHFQKGSIPWNSYQACYYLFFKFLTPDPVEVYYYLRFAASLLSVTGLFLLLSSLEWVSPLGALVMALLWNLNLLVTPVVQNANYSLFAFALACLAGYLWLTGSGKASRLVAVVLLMAAASARIEYLLLLALVAVRSAAPWFLAASRDGWSGKRLLQLSSAAACLTVPVAAVAFSAEARDSAGSLFRYLDNYLFLGLKQCYTAFSVARDSSLGLEPMTEYAAVMNRSFPGAEGFVQAVSINPLEVARYFLLNGCYNLTHLHCVLPTHSIVLPTSASANGSGGDGAFGHQLLRAEQLVIYCGVAAGGLWLLCTRLLKTQPGRSGKMESLFLVGGLAAVSLTALLLLLPSPHYWISTVPLLFWGPAALVSRCGAALSRRVTVSFSILLSLLLVNPVFSSSLNSISHRDRDLVVSLREKLAPLGDKRVKALGAFPFPLLTFAIPGHGVSIGNTEVRKRGSFESMVSSKQVDLVIVDTWLTQTAQYKKEKAFFSELARHPEVYGYRRLLATQRQDGPVAIFQRAEAQR